MQRHRRPCHEASGAAGQAVRGKGGPRGPEVRGSPGELGRTGVRRAARGKQRWLYGRRASLEKMEDFNLGEGEERKITMGRINCR